MSHLKTILISALILTGYTSAHGAGLTVSSSGNVGNPLAQASPTGNNTRLTTKNRNIRFRASCFGTNLRGVANPISPTSTVIMRGNINVGGTPTAFSVSFPAIAALKEAAGFAGSEATERSLNIGTEVVGFPSGTTAGYSGNYVSITFPQTIGASLDPVTATITEMVDSLSVDITGFEQRVGVAHAQYAAHDGPLTTGHISVEASADGSTFDISAAFPGQAGFCGGYYSPLMVFFDQERPKFDQVSQFPLKEGFNTYWPEANHAGYFIGLPNKNKKLMGGDDLFGDTFHYKNGFDKLATLDQNRDGVIDKKDKAFKQLVLWKDSTGKGQFLSKDVIPLHQKISSINLKYKLLFEAVGSGAEFRERSTVEYTEGKEKRSAEIVDVWLKAIPKQVTKVAEK
ncbi:MAG: hypothetical protein K2Q26_06995 [Bdellovibrionales bacterium]|nr:hypothetical protein [Bdellovibrionales bacterium]